MRLVMRSSGWVGVLFVFLSVAAMNGAAPFASADLTDVLFRIEASNANGTAVWEVSTGTAAAYRDPEGNVHWQLPGAVELRDPLSNALVATLSDASVLYVADPQVNLGFAVQSGQNTTLFTITSSLLSFPTITNAVGLASAAFTATDVDGNGALLLGQGPTLGAYLAQYNGFVPNGTTFAEEIQQIVAPPGGSGQGVANVPPVGYLPIAVPVNDMSAQIKFTLSGTDIASGTTNFVIIPEPAGLALLAVGVGLIRRR